MNEQELDERIDYQLAELNKQFHGKDFFFVKDTLFKNIKGENPRLQLEKMNTEYMTTSPIHLWRLNKENFLNLLVTLNGVLKLKQ